MELELVDIEQVVQEMSEGVGEWWLGSLSKGGYAAPHSPPALILSRSHFSQLWKRRISVDEWSYSTALGSQTLDVLREMFGHVGFQ